ncbi:MAG: C39 family peptidase [Treponema sp.]|nr:C39 family peptidase [Treponema sp.]
MSNKDHIRNLPVPFFSQREVRYRWQRLAHGNHSEAGQAGERIKVDHAKPAEGIKDRFYREGEKIGYEVSLAHHVCNIVSLCMVLRYYGITDDTPDQMLEKFFTTRNFRASTEANANGTGKHFNSDFRQEENAISPRFSGPNRLMEWTNFLRQFAVINYKIPDSYFATPPETNDIDWAKGQIAKGNPVMISYGATRGTAASSGHVAVIRGFTDGSVIINDPWGDAGTPDGLLIPKSNDDDVSRFYSLRRNEGRNFSSLGNGDNSILHLDEFKRLIKDDKKTFNAALSIHYPHTWAFPFRQGAGVHESVFRFSDPQNNSDEYRHSQAAEMLKSESINHAGYPISANRFWHDGIHIQGNEPVYAIGSGRLVAARIQSSAPSSPSDGDRSFALVSHKVKTGGKERGFYSHYMHLAHENIASRIQSHLFGGTGKQGASWLDQLIERIMPMRALVVIRHPTAHGIEDPKNEAGCIYHLENRVLKRTGERLPDRALVFLRPRDREVQRRIERLEDQGVLREITPEEEDRPKNLAWFYNALQKSETYKQTFTVNGASTEFYEIYHRASASARIVEQHFVRAKDVIPQTVNLPDFIYCRGKLAKLLKGETTDFSRKELDLSGINQTSNFDLFRNSLMREFAAVKDFVEGTKDLFKGTVKGEADWRNSTKYQIIRDAMYGRIKKHYQEVLPKIQERDILLEELHILSDRFIRFGRALLSFPASMLKNSREPFLIGERWYTELGKLYKDIIGFKQERFILPHDADQYHAFLMAALQVGARANIDNYIEVNASTIIGFPGRYNSDSGNLIHFDIFSDADDIIPNLASAWEENQEPPARKFVKVEPCVEKHDFFNASKTIEKLRAANFLTSPDHFKSPKNNAIYPGELPTYLNDRQASLPLQYAVVQHLCSHAKLGEDRWRKIIENGVGLNSSMMLQPDRFNSYLAYKWFSKDLGLLSRANFDNGASAVFYHPVRFLEWLDRTACVEQGSPNAASAKAAQDRYEENQSLIKEWRASLSATLQNSQQGTGGVILPASSPLAGQEETNAAPQKRSFGQVVADTANTVVEGANAAIKGVLKLFNPGK